MEEKSMLKMENVHSEEQQARCSSEKATHASVWLWISDLLWERKGDEKLLIRWKGNNEQRKYLISSMNMSRRSYGLPNCLTLSIRHKVSTCFLSLVQEIMVCSFIADWPCLSLSIYLKFTFSSYKICIMVA